MSFFNFIRRPQPAPEKPPAQTTIPESLFIEKDAEKPASTDANIHLLNDFLARNLESRGFDDALINPDSSNMQENILSVKNEFERTVKTVRQFYADFIREIDFHIDSRSRRGMVDVVEELQMKKTVALTHIERVDQIYADAQEERGEYQGIIISYTRGFKNGLAAISQSVINKKF